MSRSLVVILILCLTVSSCLFDPIITVSSDAYSTVSMDKYQSAIVFINSETSENDLSKLPYYNSLRQALISKGYMVVKEKTDADLILNFDVAVTNPTAHTNQGVNVTRGGSTTETKVKSDGTHETVTVVKPDVHRPYFSQSYTYEKTLTIKLRENMSQKLVWQATSTIDNEHKTYAPYTNALVYDAMKNFLKNSKMHPTLSQYSSTERSRIKNLLGDMN